MLENLLLGMIVCSTRKSDKYQYESAEATQETILKLWKICPTRLEPLETIWSRNVSF